eukprot:CAMPEP_0172553928 /NCGR_PEP_ID=MMETSP1067-20121228/52451_1 /TAXON_ID=265564 ORGANISM="Thalassiosira punctigera, Strain Tpunct2005C2" /NCGR_SAMPLE_ID=MMETSP1067 /ASSEMBLY_ACC=CAM_ASM_000444 /LENGTH=148 /DNA_ID=CAMNT_0013342205 /DNA_START=24 /DNA_END=466 /DNA_ORIENTATION=+
MNYQTRTRAQSVRRGRALLAAALFVFAAGAASLYTISKNPSLEASSTSTELSTHEGASRRNDDDRRSLSIALAHGGCQVTYARESEVPIDPTWQASFPGSGARMTFNLIQALTGIHTNDDYNSHERGYERVVAVKTHYPVKNARHHFA